MYAKYCNLKIHILLTVFDLKKIIDKLTGKMKGTDREMKDCRLKTKEDWYPRRARKKTTELRGAGSRLSHPVGVPS